KSGYTHIKRLLARDVARAILAATTEYEDCVALLFDRNGTHERQVIFERMDWTHPNRRGYFEKNSAFIERAPAALAEALTEDPVQVMFNGGVASMRRLVDVLRATSISSACSVAVTEYERRDFALIDVTTAGCSKGSTLAQCTDMRGLDRSAVLAVGDNLND